MKTHPPIRSTVLLLSLSLGAPACRGDAASEPLPVSPAQAAEVSAPKAEGVGEATLFLMADIRGVLRPCGCTPELQKGGFERLKAWLDAERRRFPGSKLLHAGPLFFEEAEVEASKAAQRKRQAEVTADLVSKVGFDVVAATAVDLAAAGGKLPKLAERSKAAFTAANLEATGGEAPWKPWRIEAVGGLRIGVFALAAPEDGPALHSKAKITDPEEAAKAAVSALRSEADVIVLLSGLGLRQTKRLVRAVPGIHFAVAGGLGEHPVWSDEAEDVGGTRVLQFHREGRYVGRLTLKMAGGSAGLVDASGPTEAELKEVDERIVRLERSLASWSKTRPETDRAVRSARHHLESLQAEKAELQGKKAEAPAGRSSFSFKATPLDWDLPQDPEVLAVMDAFDHELKEINLANAGTLPEAKPGEAVYAGVSACLECHEEVKGFWSTDLHAKAWHTLEEDKKTFDAECVPCHATGYGKAGGSILGKLNGLEAVQCEACHGPGSLHVESDGDADKLVHAAPAENECVVCHNSHHSPSFEFATFKKRITVPGHGLPLAP